MRISKTLLVFLAVLLLAGCGDEQTVVEGLTARELLGLEDAQFDTLSASERKEAVRILVEAEASEESHLVELDVPEGVLASPIEVTRGLDRVRQEHGLDPVLVAVVFEDVQRVDGVAVPIDQLLANDLEDSDEVVPFEGNLVVDERWGAVEQVSLGGDTQQDAVMRREPLWREIIGRLAPDADRVQIVPAPQSPFLVQYAHEHSALLVHPAVLYLSEQESAALPPPTETTAASQSTERLAVGPVVDSFPDPYDRVAQESSDGGSDCGDEIEEDCGDALGDVFLYTLVIVGAILLLMGLVMLIIFI